MRVVNNIYKVNLNDVRYVDYCKVTNSLFFYMEDDDILRLTPVINNLV